MEIDFFLIEATFNACKEKPLNLELICRRLGYILELVLKKCIYMKTGLI